MLNNISQQLAQSRIGSSPSSPSDYADPENKAFPLVPVARIAVAHSYIHKYFNSQSKGGVTATYSHQKFVTVHENIVRAMLEHGFKHYMQDALDDTLPQSTIDKSSTYGNEMMLNTEFGELSAEQIDIPTNIDIKALTEGDTDPMFATIRAMKTGISENKYNYSAEITKKIQSQLPSFGYLGHLKDLEDLSYRFREPVTIWLAGEMKGDWLFIKGYVPPEQDKLRKQIKLSIRAKKPMAVSIQGLMKSVPKKDYNDVIEYKLLSIDWANPGTEGITGAGVVQISKEQSNHKEVDMTREEILAALTITDLIKERPDLVTALKSEMVESAEAIKNKKELDDKIKTLEAENLRLNKLTIETHRTKLLAEFKDEKVRTLAGELLKGETIAELDTNLPGVKTKIAEFTKGMPIITGAADTKPGSDFLQPEVL